MTNNKTKMTKEKVMTLTESIFTIPHDLTIPFITARMTPMLLILNRPAPLIMV